MVQQVAHFPDYCMAAAAVVTTTTTSFCHSLNTFSGDLPTKI
jgi:hypothetical protein